MKQSQNQAGTLHWVPAFLLSLLIITPTGFSAEEPVFPYYAENTLVSISRALWAERRGYADMPESEVLDKVREDVAFDAWLADILGHLDYQLNEHQEELVQRRIGQLEQWALTQALASEIQPSSEEIALRAEGGKWYEPIPERYEVWYIFLEVPPDASDEEQDRIERLAHQLKSELTPENFRNRARLWSDAPSSEDEGVLGVLDLDRFGPTFSGHVRQTPEGTIGGPYRTRSGWNIVYVRTHQPPAPKKILEENLALQTAKILAKEQIEEMASGSREWNDRLARLPQEQLRSIEEEAQAYRNYLLVQKYLNEKTREVSPTEKDLRQLYEEYREKLLHPERRKAREIFLSSEDWTLEPGKQAWLVRRGVRNRARKIRQDILNGEDFGKVARAVSQAPSATQGGQIGWITPPSSPAYDKTLSGLEVGEISPPVRTDSGYLLLQLLEVEDIRPLDFGEAQEHLERMWYNRRRKDIREKLRAEFEEKMAAPLDQNP
jgi:parvulin-like peptidyl-prolyl isomerase